MEIYERFIAFFGTTWTTTKRGGLQNAQNYDIFGKEVTE